MLAELAVWLGTPVPWRFRRLGLLGGSVRLWSRGRRRSAEWADHERRCHAIVEQAITGLKRHDTVLVLGSGLARDIPLETLCARFQRVLLVDAVHLLPLRLRARRHRNVALVTRDLTGVADWLLGHDTGRRPPLADLQADPRIDLVISANVLSQLALPMADWLDVHLDAQKRLPDDLGRQIIDAHLADCAGFSARLCLLTDLSYEERARDGTAPARHDLLEGCRLPQPDASWDWHVAPSGELRGGLAQVHQACGYVDFRRSASSSETSAQAKGP
jgi:hypothetical protein